MRETTERWRCAEFLSSQAYQPGMARGAVGEVLEKTSVSIT
jgi:hypothetical protein